MENWEKVIYKGNVLNEYMINIDGCVKNIISNNICESYEISKKDKIIVCISLKINSKYRDIPLHLILAETFIPNPSNYKYVLFKDGNYKNIVVANLIWSKYPSINYDEIQRRKNAEKVSKRRQKLKDMAIQYKGGKCLICGYNRCKAALEFHHIDPNQKDFGISKDGYTRSWEKVKSELDKCVCVCANCHREIHDGIINLEEYL